MIQVRRSVVIRVGIAVGILAALGIGFAVGWAVHPPTSAPTTSVLRSPATTAKTPQSTPTAMPEPLITTSTTSPARRILAPATTEPVSDECSIPITSSADGNPDPATCPGGGVNVLAWNYMAKLYSGILGLGANATQAQVFQAMCNVPTPVGGEVSAAAQEAATYYGWSFASVLNNWYPGNATYCGRTASRRELALLEP
jgi:hypothetical protein